jgi:putative ABC transport system permease protein
MLKSYLVIAFRYLRRQRLFTLINVLGLSVGIAAFYLIFLHVSDEFSYDNFHPNADDKYRIALERIYPGKTKSYAIIPHSIPVVFAGEIPEIKSFVRIIANVDEFRIRIGEEIFSERNAMFADSNFFDFFNVPLIHGDKSTVLSKPGNIVLTRETAKKYFGDKNPLGETIIAENEEFIVSGVCAGFPGKSHLDFNFVLSINFLPGMEHPLYTGFNVYSYIELIEDAEPERVESKFPEIVDRYAAAEIEEVNNVSYEDYVSAGNGYHYFLQNIKDIYLHSQLENEIRPGGDIRYVRLFILIAVFVILIACINFMNLSTARSGERAKEVGIRKVVGAPRYRLIFQFLTESFLIALASLFFAVILIELILPYYNNLAGKDLSLGLNRAPGILVIFGITLVSGLVAGIYPSFILSGYRPAKVLKGRFQSSRKGVMLRKTLVVFQFGISLVLIIFTLFVYRQVMYMVNRDPGYSYHNLVMIPRMVSFGDQKEAFRQEILKLPGIQNASLSNVPMGSGLYLGWQFAVERFGSEVMTTNVMVVDDSYINTMGMEILEGRNFSREFNDSLSVIINETAIREFGLTDPIGKKLLSRTRADSLVREFTIVGVVNDFHYLSMHQPVNSFGFLYIESPYSVTNFLNVKLSEGSVSSALNSIREKWEELNPEASFDYFFLSDTITKMYVNESRSIGIFTLFTFLSILIASIGLFGLATYSAEQRRKEFGIRKVFGAGFGSIVFLLSREFSRLIILAVLIAIPVGYFGTQRWLGNFEFSVNVFDSLYIFVIAGLAGLIIAYITIFYQALRSALTDPSRSLKYE